MCQEETRHLKNRKTPGPDGVQNEMLKHRPERSAPGHSQAVHLDLDDGNYAQGMEGVSNSA